MAMVTVYAVCVCVCVYRPKRDVPQQEMKLENCLIHLDLLKRDLN